MCRFHARWSSTLPVSRRFGPGDAGNHVLGAVRFPHISGLRYAGSLPCGAETRRPRARRRAPAETVRRSEPPSHAAHAEDKNFAAYRSFASPEKVVVKKPVPAKAGAKRIFSGVRFYACARREIPPIPFLRRAACAESSSLAAALCSAVEEFVCTTFET